METFFYNRIENQSNDKVLNRFAFWFAFSLILNGYASGIPGLSLGSIVFIFMIALAILNGVQPKAHAFPVFSLSLGFVLTIVSFVGLALFAASNQEFEPPKISSLMGVAKFWVWVLMLSVVVNRYYSQEYFTKWMNRFAFIMTVYIIIQCIAFYGLHLYLPNIFKFGPLQPYDEGYADYDRLSASGLLRPAGFLSESSFYGNFILCSTLLYLEKNISDFQKGKIWYVFFLTFGIILSGSTSAIILHGLVLLTYINRMDSRSKIRIFFLILLLFLAFIIIGFQELKDSFLADSMKYSFDKFDYLDKSSRVGKSYGYLATLPQSVILLGAGIGNDYETVKSFSNLPFVYLNSVTSLIVQTGLIGFSIFILAFLKLLVTCFKQKVTISVLLIISYLIKGGASGIYFSTYGILLLFIAIGQVINSPKLNNDDK